jgi:DNA-binding transcriptional ArsR family regulator
MTTLDWEIGSAYEFFISLQVIHAPEQYGLRPAWAAGVRARLPTEGRKVLEDNLPFIGASDWILFSLSAPKTAATVLTTLRAIPARQRMAVMTGLEGTNRPLSDYGQALVELAEKGHYDPADLPHFAELFFGEQPDPATLAAFSRHLEWWSQPEAFGEAMLTALEAYYQSFFAEEEQRITPVLQAALEHGQALAAHASVPEVLTELSQGLNYDRLLELDELVLIPAYWSSPLISFQYLTHQKALVFFCARPPGMALIPGEAVPDTLVRTLKALADPMRLQILQHLSKNELTATMLAKKLHLRTPTVGHHLAELRLAGLLNLRLQKQEKYYSTRRETLHQWLEMLETFVRNEE